jgi:two-component system OmpR family sensor kinase
MGRNRRSDPNTRAVHRASGVVGLQITIASGALVLVMLVAAFLFILDQQTPAELAEAARLGEHKIYIDSAEAMNVLAVFGLVAVIIAGVLALVFTHRAVSPLGRALRIQRTFVQDASHELRTPLTVLDARLQVLERSLSREDPVTSTVTQLRADTRALIDIVNDLLLAADSAGDSTAATVSPVAPAIDAAIGLMRVIAGERGVRISAESAGLDVGTTVPTTSLQRCVTAFLDNAIAHSPDGSEIRVAVEERRGKVIITVADAGSGIQGIDPDRIFDRFAHSGARVSGGRASFGIGLSLVQDIAIRHGGAVDVAETSERGTTLVLTLPAVRTSAHH